MQVAESSEIKPLSPNLWEPIYGDDGGGGGWDNFDWSSTDGSADWGSTASSWQAGDPVPQVVITADKMTVWDKIEYDTGTYANQLSAAVDDAMQAFQEQGFVTVGASVGVGAAVTVDASNHDVYLSVTAGTPGPVITAGLTPNGQSQSDFLTEWGASYNAANGIGFQQSAGGTVGTVGTPGASVSWTVNASQAWENTDVTGAVINAAHRYYNSKWADPSNF